MTVGSNVFSIMILISYIGQIGYRLVERFYQKFISNLFGFDETSNKIANNSIKNPKLDIFKFYTSMFHIFTDYMISILTMSFVSMSFKLNNDFVCISPVKLHSKSHCHPFTYSIRKRLRFCGSNSNQILAIETIFIYILDERSRLRDLLYLVHMTRRIKKKKKDERNQRKKKYVCMHQYIWHFLIRRKTAQQFFVNLFVSLSSYILTVKFNKCHIRNCVDCVVKPVFPIGILLHNKKIFILLRCTHSSHQ